MYKRLEENLQQMGNKSISFNKHLRSNIKQELSSASGLTMEDDSEEEPDTVESDFNYSDEETNSTLEERNALNHRNNSGPRS